MSSAIPATGDFLIPLIIGLIALVVIALVIALIARSRSNGSGPDAPTPLDDAANAPASTSVVDPAVKRAVEKHAAAAQARAEEALAAEDDSIIGRHGRID